MIGSPIANFQKQVGWGTWLGCWEFWTLRQACYWAIGHIKQYWGIWVIAGPQSCLKIKWFWKSQLNKIKVGGVGGQLTVSLSLYFYIYVTHEDKNKYKAWETGKYKDSDIVLQSYMLYLLKSNVVNDIKYNIPCVMYHPIHVCILLRTDIILEKCFLVLLQIRNNS